MAKYTINYSCGHSEEITLFGTVDERLRRVAWLESRPCPECQHKAASAIAKQTSITYELPELTGSEKQIAWAEVIRSKAFQALHCLMPYADSDKSKEWMDGWRSQMTAKTEAAWWIDHRHDMPTAWKESEPKSDPRSARSAIYYFRLLFDPTFNG